MLWSSQFLVVLITVVTCVEKNITEGDPCTLQTTNKIGRCTHISRCAVALEEAYQDISPQVCFLKGTVPVVCCPPGGSNTTSSSGADAVGECQTKKNTCQDNQRCENSSGGGHTCHCNPGYRTTLQGDCLDIDECNDVQVCGQFGNCVNTLGSYICRCRDGLANSPASQQRCVDIDECLPNGGLGDCHQKCVNLWRSYRCECQRGFKLANDNRTCVDINECSEEEMHARLCPGLCRNNLGSYRCYCPRGYRVGADGRTCIDINECEESKHTCREEQECLNTRGGARCNSITCPDGYIRHPVKKNRCNRVPKNCQKDDSACIQEPLVYSFNFFTFVSNLNISTSDPPGVEIFKMVGPNDPQPWFSLNFVDARAPPGVELATSDYFALTTYPRLAVLSLVKQISGPQDITLEVSVQQYRGNTFLGAALAKLMIVVSEYDF